LNNFKSIIKSILLSYSQIFFSRNISFAVILLGVTFIDPITGITGLVSVIVTNLFAKILGFDNDSIVNGDYGFNSLLVGLGLGILYTPSFPFFLLVIVAALATFIFTIVVAGFLQKYNLPYLSVPFLISIWCFILASRNFEALTISARGVYKLNELYATGSNLLVSIYHYLNSIPFPEILKTYFKSLGAILFQFNILSGILIAIGLLIYSRIAFALSFLSYSLAYLTYLFMGADVYALNYSYIGFNFILTGIALGGFFTVPSKESFLWTFLLIPFILILTSSLGTIFLPLQISIYSLPFNIVVISFLFVLKLRFEPKGIKEVWVQHFSPEFNLYHYLTNKTRFQNYKNIPISLPVMGRWKVSQAYDGEITHKGEWKEAIDLIITDEDGKIFQNKGHQVEDYYCFNKPVIAPADGIVEEIVDYVDDNEIGDSNLINNWGNTVIIKHDDHIYSQISHLKKGSFKVKKDDQVQKGDFLALCGNSGRSPEPHVHFQIQSTPFIGSKTMDYPLSHYISELSGKKDYHFFDYPVKGASVYKSDILKPVSKAFHFLPGQILRFEITSEKGLQRIETWEIKTDYFNNSYFDCLEKRALAYFVNDGNIFYFNNFIGNRNTFLYRFFIGAHRVVFHSDTEIKYQDEISLHLYSNSLYRYLNDFIAPFYNAQHIYLNSSISTSDQDDKKATVSSNIIINSFGKEIPKLKFTVEIKENKISICHSEVGNKSLTAKCID
jgi:urea transporter/murein DD-endopeptidase MepM/ murein hydrolase activator NlpD